MIRLRFAAASTAALIVAALACSSDFPSGLHIGSINVLLGKSTLAVGQKATVTAVVKDGNGNAVDPVSVTWTSSNPAVATVAAAEITALSAGTTDIAATSDGVTAAATLTVTPAPAVPVATVTVGLNATSLVAGQSAQATAATLDANGAALTGRAIAWSSSNAAVATVSGSGLVVAVSAGTAQITATSEGQSGSASIQVSAAPTSSAPTQLVVAVQPAGAVSGLALSTQPMVQVRDASGNLVSGATNSVTAALSSGSGTLSGTTTVAAANGLASFTNLRIDGVGPHTLSFSATGLTAASATVTVSQTPASLSIQTQPGGATTGSALATQPVVRILDNAGLLIANSALVVSSAIASGTGTLSGGPATAVNGVATFSNLRVDGTGSVSLAFTTAAPALRATSASFPVAVGAAAKLTLTTQPAATATSGVALSPQPAVQLRDAANSVVAQSGVVVTAAIASGGGTLGGTATATTNASGVATFTNLSISGTAGARTLSFSATGLTGVTSSAIALSVPAPPPTQVTISTQPAATAMSGSTLGQQPVLQLRDASNTAVAKSGVAVTAAIASGTGTLGGTKTATTNASGVATFTNLSITGSGSFTLSFTSPGLTAATSTPVTVSLPVSDEPVFNATTGTVIIQDNFDSYTSVTAMGATPMGTAPRIAPNPSPLLVSRPIDASKNQLIPGRNGGTALRGAFTGTYQDGTEWEALNVPIPADTATHYFQYWARVTLSAPLTNTLNVKWFEAWHRTTDRVQWNTHWPDPGHPGANCNTCWQVYDQGRATYGQGDQPVGPDFDQTADGQWHRFTYAYRPQTRAGARDGFAKMWVDGVKIIDISAATLNVVPPGGDKVWCGTQDLDAIAINEGIRVVVWGSTQTTDTPPWTYDVDDFIWWIKK
ncbi:MAG TPA: Ig-like domain-containing protein [Gemmatimonadaceae bacterium]|nr:Ig-like domain-containing protein [Gemmatimonadaceae bacterium]